MNGSDPDPRALELALIALLQAYAGKEIAQENTSQRQTAIDAFVKSVFDKARIPAETEIPLEVVELQEQLYAESDRGCALIGSAFLEAELEKMLRTFFVSDSGALRKLFDGSKPLATLSAKIDFAYLVGLINKRMRCDLHAIRSIRNDFAHESKKISFNDNRIRSRCESLYHEPFGTPLAPRAKFTRVVISLLGMIHRTCSVMTRCVPAPEFEIEKSEVIKRIRTAAGEVLKSEK